MGAHGRRQHAFSLLEMYLAASLLSVHLLVDSCLPPGDVCLLRLGRASHILQQQSIGAEQIRVEFEPRATSMVAFGVER